MHRTRADHEAALFMFFAVGIAVILFYAGFVLGRLWESEGAVRPAGESPHYGPAEFAGVTDAPTVPEPLLPPEILYAVAAQESDGRHWERDGEVLRGRSGPERGIMQIAPINWPACGGESEVMGMAGNIRCADAMLLEHGALWGGEPLIRALCRYNTGKAYYRCRYGLEVFEAIRIHQIGGAT